MTIFILRNDELTDTVTTGDDTRAEYIQVPVSRIKYNFIIISQVLQLYLLYLPLFRLFFSLSHSCSQTPPTDE